MKRPVFQTKFVGEVETRIICSVIFFCFEIRAVQ